jgi:hypothetical protein
MGRGGCFAFRRWQQQLSHGVSQRVQAFYALELPCTALRKRDTLYNVNTRVLTDSFLSLLFFEAVTFCLNVAQ